MIFPTKKLDDTVIKYGVAYEAPNHHGEQPIQGERGIGDESRAKIILGTIF